MQSYVGQAHITFDCPEERTNERTSDGETPKDGDWLIQGRHHGLSQDEVSWELPEYEGDWC